MLKKITLLLIFQLITQFAYSQWKGVWGFGVTQNTFKCKDLSINNTLRGGTIFFEYPNFNGGLVPRFEMNYHLRVSDTLPNTENIKRYSNLKLQFGKILRSSKRLQIPYNIGLGINFTGGAWNLAGWGVNAKTGIRFYIARNIALFGEIGWDGFIDPEVGIRYSSGKTETKSMISTANALNIGLIFTNF